MALVEEQASVEISVVESRRPPFFTVENAIFDLPVSRYAKLVYMYLCRRANGDGASYPTITRAASDCGISPTTFKTAVAELLKARVIALESGKVSGQANTYRVLPLTAAFGAPERGSQPATTQGGGSQPAARGSQPAPTGVANRRLQKDVLDSRTTQEGQEGRAEHPAGPAVSGPVGPVDLKQQDQGRALELVREGLEQRGVSEPDAAFLVSCPEPYRSAWCDADWWISLADGYPKLDLQGQVSKFLAHWLAEKETRRPKNHKRALRQWIAISDRWRVRDLERKGMRNAIQSVPGGRR